jgi:integrase
MPRNARSSKLETRTTRLKLPIAKKPVFVRVGPGVALGYRRNQTAGTWVLRVADGKSGHWTKRLADADDFQDADGGAVLDYWGAQERARALARSGRDGDDDGGGKLLTVKQAIERYEAELAVRGGDRANAARIRVHLPDTLSGKTVALLAARDFRPWRDALARKGLSPAAINRANTCFKACLNLAADQDERITNHRAWGKGLAGIPDAVASRNVILAEATVRQIVDSAYRHVGTEFGLLVELAAVTGARVSQLGRLEVQDAQGNRSDSRLMMPSSRKGKGQKKVTRRPVPIPENLAARLLCATEGRTATAPLLTKPCGQPWKRSDHTRLFTRAMKQAGIEATSADGSSGEMSITIYALRHSNIVRQLLGGVPIRVVAVNHDTSVAMLERTYSRYIGDHSDSLSRRTMLDIGQPDVSNVVRIRRERVS